MVSCTLGITIVIAAEVGFYSDCCVETNRTVPILLISQQGFLVWSRYYQRVILLIHQRLYSMDTNKHLFRSVNNRVFAGICGGLGDYFGIDPVLLRLIWVLVVVFTGIVPGVLVYVIAIFIIPKASIIEAANQTKEPHI